MFAKIYVWHSHHCSNGPLANWVSDRDSWFSWQDEPRTETLWIQYTPPDSSLLEFLTYPTRSVDPTLKEAIQYQCGPIQYPCHLSQVIEKVIFYHSYSLRLMLPPMIRLNIHWTFVENCFIESFPCTVNWFNMFYPSLVLFPHWHLDFWGNWSRQNDLECRYWMNLTSVNHFMIK